MSFRNFVFNVLSILPDKAYLKIRYFQRMHKRLDLKNPKTFNEKLQWLKLYDRDPLYTKLVDKYQVREYVKEKIGEEYLIPLLGVWDRFDDINFDELPDEFVLKVTHDSGGLVICKDKSKFDREKARKKINSALKHNYYLENREWPYRNVPRRIIAEKYISDGTGVLNDYKLMCFNGKVDNIILCLGRFSEEGVKFYHFDKDWNYLPHCLHKEVAENVLSAYKPDKLTEMIRIAEILAEGLAHIRVDLYYVNGKIYFSELTFYQSSGFDTDITTVADREFGDKIILPSVARSK